MAGRLVLPVLLLALYAWVLGGSTRVPAGDGPHMLAQALRIGSWLSDGELGAALDAFVHLTAPHPPVGYLPLVLAATVTSAVRVVIVVADLAWLLLLLDALQRLVRPAPWWSGQLAWALASATGLAWWSADHAGFDLAAAATCAQALAWLRASEGLTRRGPAVAFGAWLAAAFLTKYSAPLILALPVVVGCLPAVRRSPRGLALAVGAFALLAVPYYAENGRMVAEYVRSALLPPSIPGNFPEERTLLQRFGGEGQLLFLAVLKENLGWPGFVLLCAGAAWARRPLPLLGVVSGVMLVGAMNSREARYALPLLYLLAAAGAPVAGVAWHHGALFVAALLPGLRASATVYDTCGSDCAVARRSFTVDPALLRTWGAWPNPAEAFLPLSEHPDAWQVDEVVAALAAERRSAAPVYIVLDAAPGAPDVSTYQLEIERQAVGIDLEAVIARVGPRGLETTSYLGPFPRERPAPPELAYLVDNGGASATWLAARPHTSVRAWALPDGAVGQLVRLR